jgi:hypothetical protein
MIWACSYRDPRATTSSLLMHVRLPGQRWYHLACFGRLSHYYEDGGCEHTDAALERMTEYGRKVTKLQPFGNGEKRPKRFARRPEVSA